MSHMLKQCTHFTNQILNVNCHKSLVSRCKLTGKKKSICFYCNKKKKNAGQIPFDSLRVTSRQSSSTKCFLLITNLI